MNYMRTLIFCVGMITISAGANPPGGISEQLLHGTTQEELIAYCETYPTLASDLQRLYGRDRSNQQKYEVVLLKMHQLYAQHMQTRNENAQSNSK